MLVLVYKINEGESKTNIEQIYSLAKYKIK